MASAACPRVNDRGAAPVEDDADGDRFVVAGDDDVDVAALFGLSADEARGLGLDGDADAPGAPDELPFPSVPFPTMRLRAHRPDGDGAFVDDAAEDAEPAIALELSAHGNLDAPTADWPAAVVQTRAPSMPHWTAMPPAPSRATRISRRTGRGRLSAGHGRRRAAMLRRTRRRPSRTLTRAPASTPRLLDAFAEESAELLDGLHVELEALERDPADRPALLEIRRIVHTIKGGAKMCGFDTVATLTHSCENLLDLVADNALALDDAALRALFECEPLLRATVQEALGRAARAIARPCPRSPPASTASATTAPAGRTSRR